MGLTVLSTKGIAWRHLVFCVLEKEKTFTSIETKYLTLLFRCIFNYVVWKKKSELQINVSMCSMYIDRWEREMPRLDGRVFSLTPPHATSQPLSNLIPTLLTPILGDIVPNTGWLTHPSKWSNLSIYGRCYWWPTQNFFIGLFYPFLSCCVYWLLMAQGSPLL